MEIKSLITFYDYQKKVFNDESKFICILKSRQIGMTYLLAFKALIDCLEKNVNVIIISGSQDQSKQIIRYIEKYVSDICEITGIRLLSDTTERKDFSNGCYIDCLATNPRTIQGYTGTVILDEFAWMENNKEIYDNILPTISSNPNYQLIISSTPSGKNNLFYEISVDKKFPDFSNHQITIDDAIKDGWPIDLELIKRNTDAVSFDNKFMCQFIDSSESYFPFELLETNISDYNPYSLEGEIFVGLDVGITGDKTSAVIIVKNDGLFYLKDIQVLDVSDIDSRIKFISDIIKLNSPKKVLIDETGCGKDFSNKVEKMFSSIVEGVNFNNEIKINMVENCRLLLEHHEVKYKENKDFLNQLNSCRKVPTASKKSYTYKFKRDKTGHSDSAIAYVLALNAAKGQTMFSGNIEIIDFG